MSKGIKIFSKLLTLIGWGFSVCIMQDFGMETLDIIGIVLLIELPGVIALIWDWMGMENGNDDRCAAINRHARWHGHTDVLSGKDIKAVRSVR